VRAGDQEVDQEQAGLPLKGDQSHQEEGQRPPGRRELDPVDREAAPPQTEDHDVNEHVGDPRREALLAARDPDLPGVASDGCLLGQVLRSVIAVRQPQQPDSARPRPVPAPGASAACPDGSYGALEQGDSCGIGPGALRNTRLTIPHRPVGPLVRSTTSSVQSPTGKTLSGQWRTGWARSGGDADQG
jgi:hypothetical protein